MVGGYSDFSSYRFHLVSASSVLSDDRELVTHLV